MSSVLPSGMRAIATQISADTSAGGFILPNDYVDVIMTRRCGAGHKRRRRLHHGDDPQEHPRARHRPDDPGRRGRQEGQGRRDRDARADAAAGRDHHGRAADGRPPDAGASLHHRYPGKDHPTRPTTWFPAMAAAAQSALSNRARSPKWGQGNDHAFDQSFEEACCPCAFCLPHGRHFASVGRHLDDCRRPARLLAAQAFAKNAADQLPAARASASSSASTSRSSSICRPTPTTFWSPTRPLPMRSRARRGASTCSARASARPTSSCSVRTASRSSASISPSSATSPASRTI